MPWWRRSSLTVHELVVDEPFENASMNEADRDWFVSRMGRSSEQDGFTRIAGRLFGYLLLSEEPRSIQELATSLGVSKASVSTEARRWVEHGMLERVPRPEDRRDFYQVAPDFFRRLVQYRIARWENAHGAVKEALARLQPSAVVAERLHYMDDANVFALESLRADLAEWDARRTADAKSAGIDGAAR
ncbi:MAG: GbsR/MarR family transcriptional regulator [Gemmatimonas sp.]